MKRWRPWIFHSGRLKHQLKLQCQKRKKNNSTNTNQTFECSDCHRKYKSRDALKKHLKMHVADYSCKTCTRTFSTEEHYNQHVEEKHKKVHLCTICGKSFWKRSVLSKHAALHGSKGKPHCCPYENCNKSYARNNLLIDHINLHTGSKPYKCNLCKRSYASRGSYSHHVKCCVKSPACKVCKKKFSSDSVLADHIKSEHDASWVVCTCGKKYRWRTNLARHRRDCSHV